MKQAVEVGEEREVKIVSTGSGGDGIAKVDGLIIFVSGAEKGEEVNIRITRVLRSYAFAEVIARLEESET